MSSQSDSKGFFDRPRVARFLVVTLCVGSAAAVLVDLVYDKHTHFGFEDVVGFHAIFGFIAYIALVNAAKLLRPIVMRKEDYYDEGGE